MGFKKWSEVLKARLELAERLQELITRVGKGGSYSDWKNAVIISMHKGGHTRPQQLPRNFTSCTSYQSKIEQRRFVEYKRSDSKITRI